LTDQDLARIVTVWPGLSAAVKVKIIALAIGD
jgi:hypothetical protein